MTADLEALVVAAYVFADEYPVPPRPRRPAQVSDAELVALAVCQAAMGIAPDRQFLGGQGGRWGREGRPPRTGGDHHRGARAERA
jgi:hypothetical protein